MKTCCVETFFKKDVCYFEYPIYIIDKTVNKWLIDKTDPSDPTRKEFFWMRKLKTLAPLGLNVLESI